jgi:hypothetical protein
VPTQQPASLDVKQDPDHHLIPTSGIMEAAASHADFPLQHEIRTWMKT